MKSETECTSMKLLLKQVYGVHTNKIKTLEDEIDELKKSLLDAEHKLKNQDNECKRCVELEEAFNSCKAALHEQSKWFENLGQKFLSSNTAESKISGEKDVTVSSETKEDQINTQVAVKKMDLSTKPKLHFLKNLMSLNTDDCQDSLELSTPFQKNVAQEFSTLNLDSLVLVPNTVDLIGEEPIKPKVDVGASYTNAKFSAIKVTCVDTPKREIEPKRTEDKIKQKKRSSNDSNHSDENIDKLDKENDLDSCRLNKKVKISSKTTKVNSSKSDNVVESDEVQISSDRKNKNEIDVTNSVKKNVIPALDVKIQKIMPENINSSTKQIDNCEDGIKSDSFHVTVSPSLLPLNEKTNAKQFLEVPVMAEDISDFQIPSSNKKSESGNWTSCNKKKLLKKPQNLKPLKSTSKFKIQLEALPPNYKKPSLKQTKLSKSIFQPKSKEMASDHSSNDFETKAPSTSNHSPAGISSKTVDFDATCIPDNFDYKLNSSVKSSLEGCKERMDNLETSVVLVKDSSEESEEDSSAEMIIEQPQITAEDSKEGKIKNRIHHESLSELKNSFDRLPKKSEPQYKYKEETVRKKTERKQLAAFDCKECEKYYNELGISDEEKQKRMHKCSRHRAKFAPPPTPEHFWELEFPDTQECKARGYLDETQKVKLKSYRKKPL